MRRAVIISIVTCGLFIGAMGGCRTERYCTSHEGCAADEICQNEACVPDTCGNGIVRSGEVCDDENNTSGDGCSADCKSNESCGNGVLDLAAGEVCDDGNTASGDGCSANCGSEELCGNGIVDAAAGEVCDDGNQAAGDGCSADCTSDETCGNGVVDPVSGEACDDGNLTAGDGCSSDCGSDESCGNGIVDAAAGEVCDDGNSASGDGCSADCTSDETCGNGVADTAAGEMCDDGNSASGDGCSADCRSDESCPNGVVDAVTGEQCDDGNAADWDGCTTSCTITEFQVNTATAGDQSHPAVGYAADNSFVVVWQSADGAGIGVYGQRFDTSGAAAGQAFQVNTIVSEIDTQPDIAVAPDGSFTVVWQSEEQGGTQNNAYGRHFDSSSVPVGLEFPLTSATWPTRFCFQPSVARNTSGKIVAVWSENFSPGEGSIAGRQIDVPSTHFQVNTSHLGAHGQPDISIADNGSFVVVWTGDDDCIIACLIGSLDIFGRRFDSNNIPIGPRFQVPVTLYPDHHEYSPEVGMRSDGSFMVVWAYSLFDSFVLGQLFDDTGNPIGQNFGVSSFSSSGGHVSLAMAPDDSAVVVWRSDGQDGDGLGVYGQRFDGSGGYVGLEFRVNDFTTGNQMSPAVAMAADGRFVTVWQSEDQDGDGQGIFAQRYSDQGVALGLTP